MKKNKIILYIGNNLSKKNKYPTSLEILVTSLTKEGYKFYISSNKQNKVFRLLDMCFSVLKYRNKIDYIFIDTFSTSNFYYALLTSQLARIFNLKYIPILHGGNLPYRLKKSNKLANLIFSNSFINISPSKYLKLAFEKYGYKTKVIHNIIDIDAYKFKKRTNVKPKLLFVRAFDKIYNPNMALYVLNELKKEFRNAVLCMIGPDRDGALESFKKLANELNVEKNVEILGVLSKEEWHKKSEEFDIFINTTNIDNTPVTLVEIMALGLPIVSTNVGGIPYLIEDKVDGLLVDKNDVTLMVQRIKQLINGQFNSITAEARKKAFNFDSKEVVKKWNEIL